jgi:hypothetical protein
MTFRTGTERLGGPRSAFTNVNGDVRKTNGDVPKTSRDVEEHGQDIIEEKRRAAGRSLRMDLAADAMDHGKSANLCERHAPACTRRSSFLRFHLPDGSLLV